MTQRPVPEVTTDLRPPCFTLINTTNVPRQLVIQGHPSLILRPGVDVKFFIDGVVIYGLESNPHAHLTAMAS